MNVGIYGGTWDILHEAHKAIISDMLDKVDVLYLIPTCVSWHKNGSLIHSYEERYFNLQKYVLSNICKDPRFEKIIVSDIERNKESEDWHFADTLKLISRRYPGVRVKVALGGDSFISLPLWPKYEQVVANSDLIVYNRPGYSTEKFPKIKHTFVDMNYDISSSQLRKEIRGISDEEFMNLLDEDWMEGYEEFMNE